MSNWPTVKLGDVCEIRAGATHHGIESEDGEYPVYGSGGFICRATKFRCPANTVTIGRKGTLDKPLLIEEPFLNIDTCFGAIPSEKIDAKYLWRFCCNFDFYSLVPSSGRPSTTADAIRDISIPLPTLAEQRAIVARLEKELATADDAAIRFSELADTAETEFKATLEETFTSLDCESVRLGDVCEKIGSGATPLGGKKTYLEDGISLIRSQNVLDFVFNWTGLAHISNEQAKKLEGSSVCQGDVLLNITGDSVARSCIVDANALPARVNQHVAIIRVDTNKAFARYINTALVANKKQLLEEAVKGSTRKALTKDFLERFSIPLPPLAEQRAIVARLTAAAERRDKIVELARRAAETAAVWRKAILKEAFQ